MSTQTAAFLVGIGLIFVAILGGGITAKEVIIPPLPLLPRILCGLLGAVLFVFGLGLISVLEQLTPNGDSAGRRSFCATLRSQAAPHAPGGIEISDRLGERQEYERIDIFVSGRGVGTLCVDRESPQVTISIAQTGREEPWTATGSEATAVSGGIRVRTIQGGGTLDLDGPGRYSVRTEQSTESVQRIWLRPF